MEGGIGLTIYIALLVLPFIVHVLYAKNRKLEVIIDSLILIAFVGLRAPSVGADTVRYINHFNEIAAWDLSSMIPNAIEHESPFYVIYAWLISRFTVSIPIYFCTVAVLHYWALGRLMLKYSTNIPFSYFIYCCLFLTLQLSGIKNTLVTTFVFLALDMAIEKKLGKFLALLVVAFLFHRTSAIVVLAYPLINMKHKPNWTRLIAGGFFVLLWLGTFVLRVPIANVFKVIGGYEDYGIQNAQPWTMTILCLAIVALGIFINDGERVFQSELLICCAAALFMPLVFVNPSSLRVVRYFLCVAIFMIPQSIRKLDRQLRVQSINAVTALFFAASLAWQFLDTFSGGSVYDYSFFWQ